MTLDPFEIKGFKPSRKFVRQKLDELGSSAEIDDSSIATPGVAAVLREDSIERRRRSGKQAAGL